MEQLSKAKSIVYHLYPGVCITVGFIILGPWAVQQGYPPQFGLLLSILTIALPVLAVHLRRVKKKEGYDRIGTVNALNGRLKVGRLVLYTFLLVFSAFLIWGLTQPLDAKINAYVSQWLPDWYDIQRVEGYGKNKILLMLVVNLVLNGLAAPLAEEFYFRGYLLPRMEKAWGKYSFVVNTVLFSVYHFWQPSVYITLIAALLPINWLVSKTKDIRLAIFTHMTMNLLGALLSLAQYS